MKQNFIIDNTEFVVNYQHGTLDKISVNEVDFTVKPSPLFVVAMRNADGELDRISAEDCQLKSFDGVVATYCCNQFVAKLTVVADDAMRFRLDVDNRTANLIEWVEVASFIVGDKLCDEPNGHGSIVYPYNEGCLVTNMAYRESMPFRYAEPQYPSKGSYSVFPNMVCSQFLAYVLQSNVLYYGMHDVERTTKHVDFCYCDGGIKLQMRTYCNVNYGESYQMPFDTVLQVTSGGWQDACELYRNWFYDNLPEGLVKISDNKRLPQWYHDSPIVVTYPVRGRFDTDKMSPNGFYPYVNALPFLNEFSDKTSSKVMALLMHWEGTAPWAPPYVWPPFGGEDEFVDFVKKAHDQDVLVGVYCSGMGWTQQSNLVAEYNREQDFTADKIDEIVCTSPTGQIDSVICTAQRKGYDLCPACDKTQSIIVEQINKVASSGVDYIQALDQNHGGNSYFCYNDKHGHVPAPGAWQQRAVNEMLSKVHGNVLLGCESASAEPFISKLQFSDNRYELNFYNGTPVPVYSYLYHEFVNNFMGNQICAMLSKEPNNYSYRVAYSFVAGDMLTAVVLDNEEILFSWCDWIEPKQQNVDKSTAYTILKNLNGWRQGAGKDYLHYGKMTKPMPISCGKCSFLLEDGHSKLVVDEVLTTAYELDGNKVQFVVNYNLQSVTVSLPSKVDVVTHFDGQNVNYGVDKITISPLSAVMIKLL